MMLCDNSPVQHYARCVISRGDGGADRRSDGQTSLPHRREPDTQAAFSKYKEKRGGRGWREDDRKTGIQFSLSIPHRPLNPPRLFWVSDKQQYPNVVSGNIYIYILNSPIYDDATNNIPSQRPERTVSARRLRTLVTRRREMALLISRLNTS